MLYWVAKMANFPRTNGDSTKPIPIVLSKTVVLLIYCKLKTNFIAESQLLCMGCPLTRERKQKKNPISIFKSARVRLRESVRLWECANTEFDWEVKRGFKKASVSRVVRLRECPLAER